MKQAKIVAIDPGGTVIGSWVTNESGEHVSMMTSEDGQHGTRIAPGTKIIGGQPVQDRVADTIHGGGPISGRPRPGAVAEVAAMRQAESLETLEERERDIVDGEPYAIDDSIIKDDDAEVQAYMRVHDHYHSAYNAVSRRKTEDQRVEWLMQLMTAIMGRDVTKEIAADEANALKLIWEAGQERARLLGRIDRVGETLAVNADSIANQQRLIQEMSKDATRGKRAFDALMLTAVRLGINPMPTDPEEAADAIRQAFIREENERDEALTRLQDLCEYAGGGREGTPGQLASHIKGAISV